MIQPFLRPVRGFSVGLLFASSLWAAQPPGLERAAGAASAPPWRLGFADGARRFLEVPPTDELCEEKEGVLAEIAGGPCTPEIADRAPVVLPQGKARALERSALAARREWWILDLEGRLFREEFPHLVGLYPEAGAAGCYYLASGAVAKDRSPVEGPAEGGLFFAFPDRPAPVPPVRRVAAEWELFGREDGELPARYVALLAGPECRRALGARQKAFAAELTEVFSQPFSAQIDRRGRPEALRLVGWAASGPKSGDLDTAWSVCRERGGRLQPLAVVYEASADFAGKYRPEVVAAVDLNGDGVDELVLSANYDEGSGYKVFSWKGGRLVQVYDAAYFGL